MSELLVIFMSVSVAKAAALGLPIRESRDSTSPEVPGYICKVEMVDEETRDVERCSGAYSGRHVITAAHCLENHEGRKIEVECVDGQRAEARVDLDYTHRDFMMTKRSIGWAKTKTGFERVMEVARLVHDIAAIPVGKDMGAGVRLPRTGETLPLSSCKIHGYLEVKPDELELRTLPFSQIKWPFERKAISGDLKYGSNPWGRTPKGISGAPLLCAQGEEEVVAGFQTLGASTYIVVEQIQSHLRWLGEKLGQEPSTP